MLTAIRQINIGSSKVADTPAVVPSFSSKGFPDVQKIIETLSPTITDSALVSAYDIGKGHISGPPSQPEYLILDSGGYECSKDMELSDAKANNYVESEWTTEQLTDVLNKWSAPQPTIAVSYDHPKSRVKFTEQVKNALALFHGRKLGKELLIKPDASTNDRVNIKAVEENIHELRPFDVIGFTEKELGYSIFNRMTNIKKVREALRKVGLDTPIHIFGSLDTISTPLYFLAGADIFDGLTWLRYSYSYGYAVYIKNAAALKHGLRMNDGDIDPRIWYENYQEMLNLGLNMKRFLKEDNFQCFGDLAPMFEKASKELEVARR